MYSNGLMASRRHQIVSCPFDSFDCFDFIPHATWRAGLVPRRVLRAARVTAYGGGVTGLKGLGRVRGRGSGVGPGSVQVFEQWIFQPTPRSHRSPAVLSGLAGTVEIDPGLRPGLSSSRPCGPVGRVERMVHHGQNGGEGNRRDGNPAGLATRDGRATLVPLPSVPWVCSQHVTAPGSNHDDRSVCLVLADMAPVLESLSRFQRFGPRAGRDLGLPRFARSAQAMVSRAFSAGKFGPSQSGEGRGVPNPSPHAIFCGLR